MAAGGIIRLGALPFAWLITGGRRWVNQEVQQFLAGPETDRVERKPQVKGHEDRIRETICALANDLPGHGRSGYLFIGVDDSTGRPTGLPLTDNLLKRLADFRSDGKVTPPPIIRIGTEPYHGTNIAYIRVEPSDSPPVRCEGRVFVRVGPSTRAATPEEERRLSEKRRFRDQPFDQRPVGGASLNDLDLDFFQSTYLPACVGRDVLNENARSLADRLVSCRFLAPDGATPTVAGLLVIGLDPQAWLPGAYIQLVRFDGTDLADPVVDDKRLDGTLYHQAGMLEEALKLHVSHASRMSGESLRREEVPDYPVLALRELVFNALIHRIYEGTHAPVRIHWFSDRIEIVSPGGLYGQVTPENFRRVTDYRNPTLAEAMKLLGYVEKFGVGIQRVYSLLAKNGNPEPEFDFTSPTHVLVTVRRRP